MTFFVTLPEGLVLCVPDQCQVFPPLVAIIAAGRRGILVTRPWRRCTGICTHLSSRAWRSSSRLWGGLSIGSQQGLRCGSIYRWLRDESRLLTVVRPALIPYRFLIRAVKARALKKRSCRTMLSNARSCRGVVFWGAPENLPGTNDPVAACLLSMRLMVAWVKPTWAAIAPCLMPSRASANTSCLIPIGVGRDIARTIKNTFEKICKYWFRVVTVWRLI